MKMLIGSLIVCFTGFAFAKNFNGADGVDYPWGDDPFLASPAFMSMPDKKERLPRLEGVLFDEQEPMAVLDGITVYKGSYYKNYVVLDIGENFVVLKRNNRTIALTLPKAEDLEPIMEMVEGPEGGQ